MALDHHGTQGHHNQCSARLWAGGLCTIAIAAPLFLMFPEIDTRVAALFFNDQAFSGNQAYVELIRNGFKILYVAACVFAVAGFFYTRGGAARFFHLTRIQHLFLIACLAFGPGVVTNLAFKDHWGRARPREITEFGGDRAFTPALLPARQCAKNCSFVSGEASSMFMVFFAFALLLPRWSLLLMVSGVLAGSGAGLVRIAQGGHFLSDVIFAGAFMALAAAIMHEVFKAIAPKAYASDEAGTIQVAN